MKNSHSMVLSSLLLSGAVFVMAPQSWSQTGGSSGAGSGAQKSDPAASGSSSERGTSGSSSRDMQTQRESGGASQSSTRTGSSHRMSKENVKQVQAALKNKGVDPGPEDGVLGPKTQQALREFQKSNNLPTTGRIDDKTASALGVDVASSGSGTGSSSSPTGSSSGMGSSGSGSATGSGSSGAGSSSSGSSATGSKSGASQSPSGAQGGTTANPPSKPTGKE